MTLKYIADAIKGEGAVPLFPQGASERNSKINATPIPVIVADKIGRSVPLAAIYPPITVDAYIETRASGFAIAAGSACTYAMTVESNNNKSPTQIMIPAEIAHR